MQTKIALNHACLHLNKSLFTCRYCDFAASCKGTIRSHLRKIHGFSVGRENYNDLLPTAIDEVKAMMECCFGSNIPLSIEDLAHKK